MSPNEIETKFMSLAAPILGDEKSRELIQEIENWTGELGNSSWCEFD